jgi:2-keto-4-pentenoate hydratase/2-oxohepta-3-ene-1,7-dioic acid hydratase in catechol pathway
MQNGYADDMIFSVPEIVSHLSKVCIIELSYQFILLT